LIVTQIAREGSSHLDLPNPHPTGQTRGIVTYACFPLIAIIARDMDGITEPVVLVLGHPIAGNPAQFALERAFASLDLGWRVLSCDVSPDRVDDAISGADVLGFRGLLLDRNLVQDQNRSTDRPDLYSRCEAPSTGWHSENVLTTWLESSIRLHFDRLGTEIGPLLMIGPPDPNFPSEIASQQTQSPIAWASTESIEQARLIALSDTVDISQWPPCKESTLVVDFSNPPNDVAQIRDLGYEVLDRDQARIGVLVLCFQRWTGKQPELDVLTEAIEEYLAV
jgi:hypothetical protein